MPYLTPKPKGSSNWLPSQVRYGIDCSDDDPTKWTAFGELADREKDAAAKKAGSAAPKSGPPAQ